MPRGYLSSQTEVRSLGYHFVWCTKYRKKLLDNGVDKRLNSLICEKCAWIGYEIKLLEIKPDYVYLYGVANPLLSPNQIINQIKGYTSKILRSEFKELRTKLPTLWSRGYLVSGENRLSGKVIMKYVNSQEGRNSDE